MTGAKEYALYRGDEFVDVGTADELAERMGVKAETVLFYASPSWRRRSASYRNPTVAVRLGGEVDG